MSTVRHRRPAKPLPPKQRLAETTVQPSSTPMTFNQRARNACSTLWTIITSPIRRCLVRTPKVIAEVGKDQMVLESTRVGKTANIIRMLPLVAKPWPMVVSQVAWGAWKYCALGVTYRFLPSSRYRTMFLASISLTGNAFRFIDDQYSAFIGLVGLLLLQSRIVKNNRVLNRHFSKASQDEIRAALYLLIWEGPALYNFAKDLFTRNEFEVFNGNKPTVEKYKKLLGLKQYNPYVDDERFFHIYKNVAHLGQEKVCIFLEDHTNKTHTDWESLSIAAQSHPKDWIVLEGVQAEPEILKGARPEQQALNCSYYSGMVSTSILYNMKEVRRPEFPATNLCVGGDDNNIVWESLRRLKSASQIRETAYKITVSLQEDTPAARKIAADLHRTNCNTTLALACDFLDDVIRYLIDLTCDFQAEVIRDDLSTDVQQARLMQNHKITAPMVSNDTRIVLERNKVLLKIIELVARLPGRIYVVFGAAHFTDPEYSMSNNPFRLLASSLQREIREGLDKSKIPYSIRLPRP